MLLDTNSERTRNGDYRDKGKAVPVPKSNTVRIYRDVEVKIHAF
jgi:hypothetical protein